MVGSGESREVTRSICSTPTCPSFTPRARLEKDGSNRRLKPTNSGNPLRLAKPKQVSISSRLLPSGFSVKTGLPASSAAWICP